jgi:TolB-like protein/Tfp pilus assembly protein PilF
MTGLREQAPYIEADMGGSARRIYEFGPFCFNAKERLLLCHGETVPLTPKALEILSILLLNRGHLVEKSYLIKQVWPDTFVVDANLAQNIFMLRKALQEHPHEPQFIETIPKRGYRFIAPVRELDEEAAASAAREDPLEPTGGARDEGGRTPQSEIKSLAVLPFTNESVDENAEYLSDGITESIINMLSQLPALRVMARATIFHYKGKTVDPRAVGRELRVQAVLEGRVLRLGERLIIRTELIDALDGRHLWGAQYDRAPANVFEVQEEIAREISAKLQIKLSGTEQRQLAKRYTENIEAYHLYLKGRFHWRKHTEEGLTRGIEYFEQAIRLDPCYALAYAGLADSYYRLSNMYLSPRECYPKAKAAALKALEIDHLLAEAHTSLAFIKFRYDWDWPGAEEESQVAIELNPGYALARTGYGVFLMLMGRFDEAMIELLLAQQLDPLSLWMNVSFGMNLYLSRQCDQAIEHYQKTLEIDPNFFSAHYALGRAYALKGNFAGAIGELEEACSLDNSTAMFGSLGYAYAASGKRDKALKILNKLKQLSRQHYVSPYTQALIYTGLGENDRAFEWLEKAYADRNDFLVWLKVDPELDRLRADPRFTDLLRRVGFSP